MSQLHLSDEILMAFADGELDEHVAAAVAKAMAEDPSIAKRIVDFQQSRRLTRSLFSSTLAPEIPPELHAAVLAQIKAYEAPESAAETLAGSGAQGKRASRSYSLTGMALAASLAGIAMVVGFFAGRQSHPTAGGLVAELDNPLIHHELSRVESGREVVLPMGRLRVISTYRLTNGSLCREFRLHAASGAADAVACRADEWNVTFALARTVTNAQYTPSGGEDPMTAYLQEIGAQEPLVDEAELKALAEAAR